MWKWSDFYFSLSLFLFIYRNSDFWAMGIAPIGYWPRSIPCHVWYDFHFRMHRNFWYLNWILWSQTSIKIKILGQTVVKYLTEGDLDVSTADLYFKLILHAYVRFNNSHIKDRHSIFRRKISILVDINFNFRKYLTLIDFIRVS